MDDREVRDQARAGEQIARMLGIDATPADETPDPCGCDDPYGACDCQKTDQKEKSK